MTSPTQSGFGQSGDLADVYRYHGIDAETVVGAALDLPLGRLHDEDRAARVVGD